MTVAKEDAMKILMIGAGVLGSLYAARLQEAGNRVTVLARGRRVEELQQHGILLEEGGTGNRTCTRVQVIDMLTPEDAYDLAIVLVRNNQLPSVLPILAANARIPSILFMVNNPSGPQALIAAVGRERVLLGFPGAGGEREGEIVRYQIVPAWLQPTTIAELDGKSTPRLLTIYRELRSAGFPVAISSNMDAWLKTHVAVVSPVANAIYLAGGSNYQLAHTRDGLALMLRAIREGLQVVKALQLPITPAKYCLLEWLPEPFLIGLMQLGFDTRPAELVMARHANAARDEMWALADEFKTLARQTGVPTPSIDLLSPYLDPQKESLLVGSRRLALQWRETWPFLLAWTIVVGLAVWLARRVK
jgi:2-dehydropantoate 2-reductase